MKTPEEIDIARTIVVQYLLRLDLSLEQRAVLRGMSVALQWVMDEGGLTLERLYRGEKIDMEKPNE